MAYTPVDVDRFGSLAATAVDADVDDKGRQKTDKRTQLPRWKVQCLLTRHGGGRARLVNVTIPSDSEPSFAPMTPVIPTNLMAVDWANENGHGVSFFADGLEESASDAAAPSFTV